MSTHCQQANALPCQSGQVKTAHSHGHGHDHSHATSSRKRLIGALAVTALVFVGELIAAYISGSLSLAADAGHGGGQLWLGHCLLAAHLSLRPRDNAYTWGWARSEVSCRRPRAAHAVGHLLDRGL